MTPKFAALWIISSALIAFFYFLGGFMLGRRYQIRQYGDILKDMMQKDMEARNGKVRDSVPLPDKQ